MVRGLDRSHERPYVRVMFHRFDHIWNDAVARNTEALKTVIASLLGLLTIYGGTEAVNVPRGIRATIMQVLRPAEAALRRIILIAARDVTRGGHNVESEALPVKNPHRQNPKPVLPTL
jgi:hypothetical protein